MGSVTERSQVEAWRQPWHDASTRLLRQRAKEALRDYGVLTSRWRDLPWYLIIGGKRCGTTSLSRWLWRQASVVPLFPAAQKIKGVHYFDRHFDRGEGWYRSFFPLRGSHTRAIAGEASPYYLYHPSAAARAGQVVPHARVVVLLRDPVERAFSHFRDETKLGHETRPFLQALEEEEDLLIAERRRMAADPMYYSFAHEHHGYVDLGRYADHLARWLDVFPREQVLVLRSEDLFAGPEPVLAKVRAHLDLPFDSRARFIRENAAPRGPSPDAACREWLRDAFAGSSERLSDLLGVRMVW